MYPETISQRTFNSDLSGKDYEIAESTTYKRRK